MQLIYRRALRRGMIGEDVRELQRALVILGYDPKGIDGSFGLGCDAAVRQFQKDNNLVVDGSVGPATIRVLNANLYNMNSANPVTPKVYRKIRQFSSDVHIMELESDKFHVDVELGQRWKLEKVSTIVRNKLLTNSKTIGGINAGFYNFSGSSEHLGLLIDEGLYYTPPTPHFIDFIFYKDGTSEIINLKGYDRDTLNAIQKNAHWGIGTSYSLVQNGRINLENSTLFDHFKYRHPRTLLGRKPNGNFLLVVVDGRTASNLGVTGQQSAEIMMGLGAHQAVNLDGGGSSTMIVVESGVPRLKNRPSNIGGLERAVGSTLIVYEK